MKPQTIGRVLGIGVRLVGRMAGQRIMGPDSAGTVSRPVTIEGVAGSGAGRVSGRTAGRASGSLARGVGGFFKPFRRVGNIVFLEVVGVFFFVFVLVFGTWAWRLRWQAAQGPEHTKFLVYAAMTLVFLYLSVS